MERSHRTRVIASRLFAIQAVSTYEQRFMGALLRRITNMQMCRKRKVVDAANTLEALDLYIIC